MSISEEDKIRIAELREAVKSELTPYYDTDFNLLRWLKGHNNDLDVIKPKLLNHLIFRKLWKLDTMADEPRDHPVHRYWKFGMTGPAKPDSTYIVNIEQSGGNDYWGMLHAFPINQVLRARVHDLECMLREVMRLEAEKKEQCHVMYIMDLHGLTMDRRLTTLVSGGLAAISAFMTEHYVEMVSNFVLVNVPSFISVIWSIAKPLLPERTRNKVNILGRNWREEILQLASPQALPAYWNDEGEDVPFLAKVEKGVPVPKEEYYVETALTRSRILQVPAGKDDSIDIVVHEPNSRITWKIHADGHFAFKVIKVGDNGGAEKRIYPLFSKVPGPTIVPLEDGVDCVEAGNYKIWFSNAHAWFHKLTIEYEVETTKI